MDPEITQKKDYLLIIKNNSKKIFIFIILLIIIFLTKIFMDFRKNEAKNNISESFVQGKIFIDNKQISEAKNIFEEIVYKKDNIYSPLALFLIIDKELEKDKKIIIRYFDEILSLKNFNKEDKNLIKLKKAIFISETGSEKDILDLLNPIINSDSVWKVQSTKFLGDYYYSLKQYKKSKEYYLILLEEKDRDINYKQIRRKIDLIKDE
tara:strand:- start:272 stop:895 length:624 start_codon:yes stop_codon:yes gene_type:complete